MANKNEVKSISEAQERLKQVIKSEKITNKPLNITTKPKKI